jgi:hypothetical protein
VPRKHLTGKELRRIGELAADVRKRSEFPKRLRSLAGHDWRLPNHFWF